MDLYPGTLFDILHNSKIDYKIKRIFVFTCMYQIAYYLNHLQNKFKFNHNDLK